MATRSLKSAARSRGQKPLSRMAKIVGGVAGALLVWQVTAISLAAGHGDEDGDIAAADYASTSPAAATAAAEQRLADKDPAGAKVFAAHALTQAPISAAALRSLSLAEQGLGNWQSASALLSQSAALGWRDASTQLLLAQAFLQQKDYANAAERLDAALRTNPQSTDLFNLVDQSITQPDFARAMADRLQYNPDWRPRYFTYTRNIPEEIQNGRVIMVDRLSRSNASPSRDEIRPLIYTLINAGKVTEARKIWAQTQHLKAGVIYDPKFEHVGTSAMLPFEWTKLTVLGANLTVEPATRGPGMLLRAQTDGSASGVLLRQMISLSPGRHFLRYSGSIPAGARNAFGWAIHCAQSGETAFSSMGSLDRPPYQFDISDNCGSQMVELRVAHDPAAENIEANFVGLDVD